MTRYIILILFALGIASCGSPSSSTPVLLVSQVVGERTADVTFTEKAPFASPMPSDTSTPIATSMPAVTATAIATPSPSSTSTPGTIPPSERAVPSSTPTSTPTPVVSTRSEDGMLMVFVPAGDFTMGSLPGEGSDEEFPQHKVTLDGYWIDRTEVTNQQYRQFVEQTGHPIPTTCDWGDPTFEDVTKVDHPVVCVSWDDAGAYCKWAGARLPTEAEWEKAARGIDRRTYPWGFVFDGTLTNYCDINCEGSHKDLAFNDGYARTAPVGSYPMGASPYGALDMAGNVWEWVSDSYGFYYYAKSPQLNPQGPGTTEFRVLRGGSWYGFSNNERVAFRAWMTPANRDMATGFRCVVPVTLLP